MDLCTTVKWILDALLRQTLTDNTKRTLPKINQVMKHFWPRNNIQTVETVTPWKYIYIYIGGGVSTSLDISSFIASRWSAISSANTVSSGVRGLLRLNSGDS